MYIFCKEILSGYNYRNTPWPQPYAVWGVDMCGGCHYLPPPPPGIWWTFPQSPQCLLSSSPHSRPDKHSKDISGLIALEKAALLMTMVGEKILSGGILGEDWNTGVSGLGTWCVRSNL